MNKVIQAILILLISNYYTYSQCNFVLINSTTDNFTVNGTSLAPCLNQATFTVNMENVSPFYLSNFEVTIDLPDGVNYIAGSSSNATETNITDLNNPVFSIADIDVSTTNNNTLSFTIDVDATCELQTFLDAGGIVQNVVNITNDATNNGSTINCNIVHTSQVYSASVPNLSITNITEQSHIGTVGEVFQRCISIINGGSGGLAQFSLHDVHGTGIGINSVDVGTVVTNGTTEEITFNGADFTAIGNGDNIFDPGETLIICETVQVLSCVSTASTFRYFWGCNNENCQELTDGANVTFPGEIPDLKMQRYNNFRNSHTGWNNSPITNDTLCFTEDGVYTSGIYVTNSGSGTAYNVFVQMDSRNTSSSSGFDVSNIRMTRNGVPQPFHRDSLINPTRYGTSWSSCLPANSVGNIDYVIDSVAPGDTVYIEWDWFTCFQHKSCTNRQHMLLWYYKANYENKCSQSYEVLRTGGSYWTYFNHTFSLDNSPGTMIGNSTANVSYVNNSWYHYIPRNQANDQFRFQIVMPSCLGFDASSFKITRTDGVVYSPNSSTRVGDTINVYYTDIPVPNGGTFNESTIDYDITLDCSSCGSGSYPIEMTSYYTPNIKTGCDNELRMGCNSFNVNLVCPDPCPGINFNKHYAKRINLGLPDNDNNGLPDPAGTIDYTQIRQDRMIFGDTLQILHGGNVNNSLNDSIWPYVVATTELTTGGHLFTYVDAEFTLYQVATGTYHTATIVPAPIVTNTGTTKDIKFELDLNALNFTPALPANYSLQDQDSVFLKSNYKVTKNVNGGIVVVSSNSRFYCSDIATNAPVTNQFGCPNLIKNFTVLGFYFYNCCGDSRSTKSCDLVTFSQNYYLYIAGTHGAKNKFRNEYRPFAHPENLKVTLPDSYTYESSRFIFYRTTGVNSRSSTSGNTGTGSVGGWYPLTPSTVVGNEYTFNTDAYYGDDPVNDSIMYGDEGYYGTFQITVSPNCSIEGDTSKRIRYDWEFETVPQWYGTTNNAATHTSNSNYYWDDTIVTRTDEWISYDKPKLLLQSNLISQNVPSNTAVWNVSITNNSNTSDAHNSWFGIPTIGTVVADSLYDQNAGTMVYPSPTGIFQMGNVNAAQTLNYTIYTHINGCNSDSIVVYHGWDCSGYPIDVNSYTCNPLQTTLYITPLMPELSNYITVLGGDTIGLCDTARYEVKVTDFQLGNAFNLTTSINVPSGMIIEPGSCYLKYPESGTYVSIPNPVNTSGNNWEWDISALNAIIGADGLQGVLDQTLNKYYIRFSCLTDCDYVSGSRVTCLTTGEARCGRLFNSNVGVSNQVFIGDALPPYEASIRINTTYITPCLGNTPVELVVVNNGPLSFGANDSVYFRLDNGISYDANSFTGILNAPINGVPSIVNNNGVDELAWKLPQGVGVGDTTKFSFTINGSPDDLECGVLQLASQITTYGGAVCSSTGSFCNIDIATADTLKNIFIYKGYLDMSNSIGSYATPNAPSGETGNISFDIFNSGETISTGTETIIQFYQDTDNDGVFSAADTYITNDTIQDQLTSNSSYGYSGTIDIPGGSSCKLIAVIDTSLNPCTCTPAQILINLPLISPATSHTVCSDDVIQIGNQPINTYTYSWNPVGDIDNGAIAQPNFSTTLNYPATNTFQLVRTIDRGLCFATDTVDVLVYSMPIALAGADQDLCNIYTTTLAGNQPQGTATGMWSEDASHVQPSTVTFTDATQFDTDINNLQEGTYQLVWTVSNGTCTPATDTVVINVYDQPTADAGVDQDLCNIYTTTLAGNAPQGTATGMWSEDASHVQPSAVTFTDATQFDTDINNLQEGTYQLVWTVSNGTCTPATDTVVINVYDQPTA
ncbi:MAG: hypothetical protein N4A35_08195, partial [Flavobacteriales bacterium]|nr:hypothetical protein [Flavobacteriales bacterium]